jgi:mannose-6-phosphate isomerase-like protein (cupin superfamily)
VTRETRRESAADGPPSVVPAVAAYPACAMSEHEPDQPTDLPDAEPSGEVLPVDLRDWVDFSTAEARRVRVFATETLSQDLWCVEPQQATSVLRFDDVDVAYTVVGGRAWFVTEQGEVGLDPLASVLVPAGVTHGIDNRGADPLIVLAVAGPPAGDGETDQPLTRLAEAIREDDTTGGILRRLKAFVGGVR